MTETPADELFSNIAPVVPTAGHLIPPLTEAIHYNHREVSEGGRSTSATLGPRGGCQGCHPAHRSDGDMDGYPIDLDGNNFYADWTTAMPTAAASSAVTCTPTR